MNNSLLYHMYDTGRPGGYPEVSLLQIKKKKKKISIIVFVNEVFRDVSEA